MAEIRHQIAIEAPPEKVYAALATQAGLRAWWTADTIADHKTGGKAEFGFDTHTQHGVPDDDRKARSQPAGDLGLSWRQSGMDRHHPDLDDRASRWRQPAAVHAKRMEGHDRHGRDPAIRPGAN